MISQSALSYVCFLGLVWWIWGSQVLYNIRFRQRDWVHRIFIVLQLLLFCGLAAYARGFDISRGIVQQNQDGDPELTELVAISNLYIDTSVAVEEERSGYLSLVNNTGISVMIALSRLLLLIQYTRGKDFSDY